MTIELVTEAEVFRHSVILEASVQQLYHVVLVLSPEDLEVLEVAHVSLLILPECDVGHQAGPLQPQGEELGRGVGVR